MQDNLFAELCAVDKRIQDYRAAPPKLTLGAPLHLQRSDSETGSHAASSRRRKSVSISSSCTRRNKIDSFSTYYRVSIDNVDKVVENSLLRSSFVIYQIRFTRLSDLADRAVWKRYKELYTFYLELLDSYPELDGDDKLQFPTYDKWTNNKDPNSEFIQRRRSDLESFFRVLFSLYPSLAKFPRIVEFFELDYLPSEDPSSILNYYHECDGEEDDDAVDAEEDNSTRQDGFLDENDDGDDDNFNNESKGGLFGFRRKDSQTKKQDDPRQRTKKNTLFKFDKEKSVLAAVQRSGLVYDPLSATLIPREVLGRRNNTGESYLYSYDGWLVRESNQTGTNTSIAAILRHSPYCEPLPIFQLSETVDRNMSASATTAIRGASQQYRPEAPFGEHL